jgi:peptide/nickel transport system ATP-binding protein
MTDAAPPLLAIRDVCIDFASEAGAVSAVRAFNLVLQAGRTLAIVGESGSGKSTVAAAITGLLAENGRIRAGEILFEGRDLSQLTERQMREVRGAQIGFVPQNPMTNLNPLQRIGTQIAEALMVHGEADAEQRVIDLLALVGIPQPAARSRQYPHQLSGGMRQRVLIAMGFACKPRLLIADEPTSALDVTVQRVILDELNKLTKLFGTSLILITHDLALAAERADDVLVLYRGDVVESGPAADVLRAPAHAYTQRLIAAAPSFTSRPLVRPVTSPDKRPLVELIDVRKTYPGARRWFGTSAPFVAVAGSSFTILRGQTVALVGESGSGKSTTAKLLLKIERPTAGDIVFDGKQVTDLSGSALLNFRRRVQPVFQNALGSLDGRYTLRQSIEEPLILHNLGTPRERRARVDELLEQVALPHNLADRRPAEVSGGQCQRVAIARALALSPDLIVLDEAVSALDVIVQLQVLELLARLQQDLGLAYLFISHDLAVVRMIAHEVHVMRTGHIVESGTPESLFARPQHEYTRQLIAALPHVADAQSPSTPGFMIPSGSNRAFSASQDARAPAGPA